MLVGKFVRSCAAAVGALIAAYAFQAGSAAHAADLYGPPGSCGYGGCGGYRDQAVFVPPPPLWQGFYIGGFAGAAWSELDTSSLIIIITSSAIAPFRTIDSNGVFGGGQFGYNFEWGRFVYGLEADLGGMDTGATLSFSNSATGVLQVHSSGGFFGDITTRGGYLYGNALVYVKGGWAFFTGNLSVTDNYGTVNLDSSWFSGWTVGTGVEYMVAPNWSIKAEYQYFDLSDNGYLGSTITSNTFKIGFNWFPRALPVALY